MITCRTKSIATHDSVTGEKGRTFIDKLLTPFARTQTKTIAEQQKAGVRFFDIRTRYYTPSYRMEEAEYYSDKEEKWICCHGIWDSKKTLDDVLSLINQFSTKEDPAYVQLVCEREKDNERFAANIINWIRRFKNIKFNTFAYKKPTFKSCVVCGNEYGINEVKLTLDIIHIDKQHWWNYICPIPYILFKLQKRKNKIAFTYDDTKTDFQMIDFY